MSGHRASVDPLPGLYSGSSALRGELPRGQPLSDEPVPIAPRTVVAVPTAWGGALISGLLRWPAKIRPRAAADPMPPPTDRGLAYPRQMGPNRRPTPVAWRSKPDSPHAAEHPVTGASPPGSASSLPTPPVPFPAAILNRTRFLIIWLVECVYDASEVLRATYLRRPTPYSQYP